MVARINISISDGLSERLERVRDRLNVSKVCAVALEKELDMIEGRPAIADPKIARLAERLKNLKGQWYERGHEDGLAWGVDKATRVELQAAGKGESVAVESADNRIRVWVLRDLGMDKTPAVYGSEEGRRFTQAIEDVDNDAYVAGWRDALAELWKAVAPLVG